MSSSSVYEPDDDEEASDADIESRYSSTKFSASSPPIDDFEGLGSTEPEDEDTPEVKPRATRGTRAQILDTLRTSLGIGCVDAYSAEFAESASNTVPFTVGSENYNPTQNGVAIWASQEKEILFSMLDRKGENGIAEIAQAIGSKSELEVQEHLKLLHRGLERQHVRDSHSRTIVLGEVPAALEISQECCKALDDYAELLALEEQRAEDAVGRRLHQNVWIVDREVAEMVEEQLEERNETPLPGSSVYVTAELFNINKWIRLSERFFMNAGGPRLEDNWVNVACADETPSITADALADFYALAVSVTRRLVHSTLFFAMSRLRNMRETGNRKARIVRARDVKTALNVLSMPQDRFDFWVGLARRCSLQVADLRHKKGWQSELMDYDEVEDILSGKVPVDETLDVRSASRRRSESRAPHDTVEDDDDDNESDVYSYASSILSSPEMTPVDEPPVNLEEEHAEAIDQLNNASEEMRLWDLMGQPAPSGISSLASNAEQGSKLRKPIGERKTKEDLVNWRDRTLYRSEWEEYGHEVHDLYEDLSENRRKRRRIERHMVTRESPVSVASDRDHEMGGNDDSQGPRQYGVKNELRADDDPDHDGAIQIEETNDAMDIEGSINEESGSAGSGDLKMDIETDPLDQGPSQDFRQESVEYGSNEEPAPDSELSDGEQTHPPSSREPEVKATASEQQDSVPTRKGEAIAVHTGEQSDIEVAYDSDSGATSGAGSGSDEQHDRAQNQGGVPVIEIAGPSIKRENLHLNRDSDSEPEQAPLSNPESDEGSGLNQKPSVRSQIETRNERIHASEDTVPVVKEENVKFSQSQDSESEYETDSQVEPGEEGKPRPHIWAPSQPVIEPERRLRGTDSDSYLDSDDSDSDEHLSARPQRGVKLEPNRESSQADMAHRQSASEPDLDSESGSSFDDDTKDKDELYKNENEDDVSSGSDDDLPYDRHQKREESYLSSEDEDEKNSLPLHSQPMSPVV
ncbi:hypothetical protein IFM58399_03287 [Aspergillus lentulus]|uniref:Myb-like domain-containing protein n=1 Tax=Aspergillus lentulus TaxID=293939 RepID=A0ABQ1A367_ASPLE|nr:uncharacterized protein IFM58399_03287 [Aspergillus lentulus]KAF4161614.1 hypothetical protein CNMCM6069_003520 [Aspergillus lentulus]KAF4170267.1 hypothetical protein CNMCM6936_003455 [Aspergillus lentulus]GFF32662.1 hypothetical protein IFM58399_03287 [Aspergillus lentulus]GFF56405.1 hypothetical protein IFM62136_03115 [Aspergillus lentulus]GFF70061.1 hypothetical protein IFM60648_03072 [Aspergillus lentulus]